MHATAIEPGARNRDPPEAEAAPGSGAAELSTVDADERDRGDAQLLTALHSVSVRLEQRFPDASPAVISCCVDRAIERFSNARVQNFLPILIEREAADSLRAAAPASARETRPAELDRS